VAVGDRAEKHLINSNPPPAGVRRYVNGLINGLNEKKYRIGETYDIHYRQWKASELPKLFHAYRADHPDPSAIFCMSTRVVDDAVAAYRDTKVPIVGVVSDFGAYKDVNVCGFSAQRYQNALSGYQNFITTVPSLSRIQVLTDSKYPPCVKALNAIKAGFPEGADYMPSEVDVCEEKNIETQLNNAGIKPGDGLFVLPLDRCFGDADAILAWAADHSVPTFWPVTDWVKSTAWPCALGGYGVSQELCGYRMAGKLAEIWSRDGALPDQRFDISKQDLRSNDGDFSWIASLNAFKQLKIDPPKTLPPGLNII
jgi:hypothetical protein